MLMTTIQGKKRLAHFDARNAVFRAMVLAIACMISFWLKGMWAVVATIFVFRYGCTESLGAALSRMSATEVSFALCFVYLLILPFTCGIWQR